MPLQLLVFDEEVLLVQDAFDERGLLCELIAADFLQQRKHDMAVSQLLSL